MRVYVVILFMIVLGACQPQQPSLVLPTQADFNAPSTERAATTAANGTIQAAASASFRAPTLPPTWTPSPEASATPFLTPTPNPSQAAAANRGAIYYIYNGDSIARVPADGSGASELILLASGIAWLTLSPDGTLLAYAAQGSGSAREVFISSLDGTYRQQISCLGFARMLRPTWNRDSSALAFLAAQTPDGPMDIYVANVVGSNTCPTGNNQRQLTQLASHHLGGMAWSLNGERIYFSDGALKAVDLHTGFVFNATRVSGWGADTEPLINPRDGLLYFLRPQEIGRDGGQLFSQDVSQLTGGLEPPQPTPVSGFYATQMMLSSTGDEFLLAGENGSIVLVNPRLGSTLIVVENLASLQSAPVFSPDNQQIAYVALGSVAPQIYVVGRVNAPAAVITDHTEGTVAELVWAAR
jgi:hypothetical protein